ncbi:hypothetical protein [Sphingobacterium sp. UGAL515B_05]|uniref:hypothetical protein n=1 Tax=Sphingobacterium sp. UGAL515B_05 TaxID=2986767 RepID=UPI002955CD1C|nr:hypothetical protein [Sphingobacterium sp. UGAL515B_05]WON94794.1 hypothetical protein OK025_26610 [Sphingobacterium sp. UGAL515B_05]
MTGLAIGNREGLLQYIICLLIGLPYYSIVCLYCFTEALICWLDKKLIIKGWYRLRFTDYFSRMNETTIAIRRAQYFGEAKNLRKANWYDRFFLRQIDKKYGYGITKGDPKP